MGLPKTSAFDVAAVNAALVGTRFGGRLQHFPSVASTNSLLLEAAAGGAPEGTVVVADEQTAGRGRGGHAWHSSAGEGLYVSALTMPSLALNEALQISLATGLAAQTAINESATIMVDLRWPNDLLFNRKKCGGILVETAADATQSSRLRYAVIGIGINVNHCILPPGLSEIATSLRIETGMEQSRSALLINLLRALDRELSLLEAPDASQSDSLLERFARASTWVHGKRVSVPEHGGYTGVTAGLDRSGYLRVKKDDGALCTVLTGGVREL